LGKNICQLVSVATFFLCYLALNGLVYAQQKPIELVTGLSKPPFVLEETNDGMQLDLIREAFSLSDINVKFIHMPLGRNITGFQRWDVEGVITLPIGYEHPGMFTSKPYIIYQNVAVSLTSSKFNINTLADLSGKSVAAFQNAKKFLGEEYKKTLAYSLDYREVADQSKQIAMLFSRQTEVIILDVNIFRYFMRENRAGMYNKPFNIHYIFNERPYVAGFKTEAIRDKFDQGIQALRGNGRYKAILDKYLR